MYHAVHISTEKLPEQTNPNSPIFNQFAFFFSWLFRFPEFRGYINNNFPSLLEVFYKTGEFFDPDAVKRLRDIDTAVWTHQESESK